VEIVGVFLERIAPGDDETEVQKFIQMACTLHTSCFLNLKIILLLANGDNPLPYNSPEELLYNHQHTYHL
jgi:hypothetical protein